MNEERLEKIKNKLSWNFKFEDEFKTKQDGYTFIIDVIDGTAFLSLYRFSPYGCKSEPLEEKQPPIDMLKKALADQGNEQTKDGFYYIDEDLKKWLEKEFFKIA